MSSLRLALQPVRVPSYGFEWKSSRTFLGYPLVHIAFGRDRRGKLRVAKGIIAIGQFGIGLISVAQFGVGLLFGFGQFVAGLTVLAQFAGGLLVGVGQFATGYVAFGQVVLAITAWANWAWRIASWGSGKRTRRRQLLHLHGGNGSETCRQNNRPPSLGGSRTAPTKPSSSKGGTPCASWPLTAARGDNQTSKTELVLQKFPGGARRAGAETETLYLRDYKIKHCLGAFPAGPRPRDAACKRTTWRRSCLTATSQADLAVLATPLYHYNMNARMKMFIERTLPMVVPGGSADQGGVSYRFERVPKVAVISVCANPAMDTFRCLSLNMQMILGDLLVAEIYRHTSEAMMAPPLAAKVQEVLAAVARAGEELVQQGQVQPETLAAATQDLAPPELIMQLGKEYWRGSEEGFRASGAEPRIHRQLKRALTMLKMRRSTLIAHSSRQLFRPLPPAWRQSSRSCSRPPPSRP